MLLNELETIYTASDAEYQRVADRVDSRLKQSTKNAEKELREQQRATEKLYRDQASAVEKLINRVPGGQRITQFKALADDIKLASSAAKDGEGALAALGGASGAALIGIGALAIGVAAVGAGVVKAAFNFAEFAGHIKDLGQESGLTAPTLSTIGAYARLAGSSVEQANGALEVYLKNVAEAAHGNEATAKTFQRFGIDAKEALKNPDLAARQLFDTLAKIPNAADRLDASFKLAGKSGKVLANIAQEMGGDFAQAMNAAREWGVVLSEDDVKAADKFGDAWEILKMKVEGVIFDIARGALPELQKGIDDVTGSVGNSHDAWQEFGRDVGGAVREVLELIKKLKEFDEWVTNFEEPGYQKYGRPDPSLDFYGPGGKARGGGQMNSPDQVSPPPSSHNRDYDIKKKGGGGGGAANRAAKAFLDAARVDLREAESVYKEENAIAKRALELNLNDFADYQQRRTDAETERWTKQQEFFTKELQAAGTNAGKIKDIKQREQDALREHNERKAQITTEGLLHDLDVKQRFAEAGASLMVARQRVADVDIARQIAAGTKTNEEAVRERFAAMARVAEEQGKVLQIALVKALGGEASAKDVGDTISETIANAVNAADVTQLEEGFKTILGKAANKEAVQEALQAILEFFLKRKEAFQENNGDVKSAQEDDLANWQSYANRLAQIFDEIQAADFARRELEIAPLSDNNFNRGAAIEARHALDVAREEARAAVALDALRKKLSEEHTRREGERPEVVRAINAQIGAEERLSQARIVEIDRQANEERRRQLVEIANDIAGILTTGLEKFDGTWKSVWSSMLQSALSVLKQIGAELLKMSLEGLFTGQTKGSSAGGIIGFFANAIGGALLGGRFGGGAAPASTGNGISLPILSSFGHHAKGGTASGWSVVGEEGPELAFFGSPAEIFSNGDSQRMIGGGGEVNDNRKIYNIIVPPPRTPSTHTPRRGAREQAEGLLAFIR